jgi:hypothetical protein
LLVVYKFTHYVKLLCKCRPGRRKQRGAKNWLEHHIHAINAWNARANNIVGGGHDTVTVHSMSTWIGETKHPLKVKGCNG